MEKGKIIYLYYQVKKIKIITAINNKLLNEKLIEKGFDVICKDIQYQDGIFEQLEKSQDVDVIIISSVLPGNIRIERIVNKIKELVKKIRIIIILEEKNENLEDYLYEKGIYDIYYHNQVEFNTIINLLSEEKTEYNNYKKSDLIKEINNLKKIIEKNNINKNKKENNKKNFIISILGINGIGKTTISIIIALFLCKNKKILIVSRENNLIKKINKKIRKNIEISEKINKKELYDYIILDNPDKYIKSDYKILIIGGNLFELYKNKYLENNEEKIIINKNNINSLEKNIIEELFKNKKIIGEINYSILYNKFINSQFLFKIENKKIIKKQYKKIIKKIESEYDKLK